MLKINVIAAVVFFFYSSLVLNAQEIGYSPEIDNDTLSYLSVEADIHYHLTTQDQDIDTLIDNVIITQDSLVMYCDWAIVIDHLQAKAYNDVVIIHEDSVQIFADSMHYDGLEKVAELFGEVILQDGEQRLFTNYLIYNVDDKIAKYLTGATIIDGVDTIISKKGYYYQKEQVAELRENVSFRDTVRTMEADSINYFYNRDQIEIISPTKIFQDSIVIYCEEGIYQLKNDRGVLSRNVQVKSDDQLITAGLLDIVGASSTYTFLFDPKITDSTGIARGDTIIYYDDRGILEIKNRAEYTSEDGQIKAPLIIYDKSKKEYSTVGRAQVDTEENLIDADEISGTESGSTLLRGKVKIRNKESQVVIVSDEALQKENQTKVYSVSNSQPLLSYPLEGDSLFLKADTLINQKVQLDSNQESSMLIAKLGVKLKNKNTYGTSRDFVFDQQDSVITMWGAPILWSDSTQLTGDTIRIYISNNEVRRVTLIDNAFILSPDSIGNFNQIKGLKIENFLDGEKIVKSHVNNNAELFYLVENEGLYEGVNLTKSSEMTFLFDDDGIRKIQMNGVPESNMYEYIEGMDLEPYFLDGFVDRSDEKPEAIEFVNKVFKLLK